MQFRRTILCIVFSWLMLSLPVCAEVTPEQRKELAELNKSLTKVAAHVRKKEFTEAQDILTQAQTKLDEIAAAAMVEKTDRALAAVVKSIERQQSALDKAQGKTAKEVSFAGAVAPLIQARCLGCHGENNPRNGLRLDMFAGWRQGGRGGPLLAPGNAARSLLMARLSAPQDNGGMPAQGDMLTKEELAVVASWINAGAKFDGSSDRKSLGDVMFDHDLKTAAVQVPKPKGGETVSFTRDIAPWFQTMCVRCHNEQRSSGGLSLVSFYSMMKGGESGTVVIPGDAENSRLFRLTGGLENPRMPADNQVRITRKNYEDLKKWFDEGNTFDGDDPRAALTTYVKSPAQIEAERFASMTEEEFRALRRERTESQFKRAVPNDTQTLVESDNFLIVGSVDEARLKQVQGWADEQVAELEKTLGGTDQLWKGKLAIFVFKDRFGYDEFSLVVEQREAAREVTGHSRVTPTQEDAYVVLQDIGDDQTAESAGLRANLITYLTGAFVRRNGGALPEWVVQGTGLVMADRAQPGAMYFRELRKQAEEGVKGLGSPASLFQDGSYSPATLGAVGYALVDYLMDASGNAKLRQFLSALQSGQSLESSLGQVYGADPASIAQGFYKSLSKR